MKTMDEVDRIHLLKDLWKTFREGLETQLDETLTARVDTTNSGRIDAEILWNSLERCKHPLAVNLGCHRVFPVMKSMKFFWVLSLKWVPETKFYAIC